MLNTVKSKFFIAAIVSITTFSTSVFAQQIAEDHMAAARKALSATKATESFDGILIQSSAQLKNQLTANSPDKADEISSIVDEEAIALASRRGDLEVEGARHFANIFSKDELELLSEFFNSPTGSKYLDNAPILARELSKSARIWANGINRDLAENVTKRLQPDQN